MQGFSTLRASCKYRYNMIYTFAKPTEQWKLTLFNGKTHYFNDHFTWYYLYDFSWSSSFAMNPKYQFHSFPLLKANWLLAAKQLCVCIYIYMIYIYIYIYMYVCIITKDICSIPNIGTEFHIQKMWLSSQQKHLRQDVAISGAIRWPSHGTQRP